MITATVSSKYQVVIPKEIREKLNIKVGQKFQILHYGERIEFIPQKSVKRMRGFLKGIDTEVIREAGVYNPDSLTLLGVGNH